MAHSYKNTNLDVIMVIMAHSYWNTNLDVIMVREFEHNCFNEQSITITGVIQVGVKTIDIVVMKCDINMIKESLLVTDDPSIYNNSFIMADIAVKRKNSWWPMLNIGNRMVWLHNVLGPPDNLEANSQPTKQGYLILHMLWWDPASDGW